MGFIFHHVEGGVFFIRLINAAPLRIRFSINHFAAPPRPPQFFLVSLWGERGEVTDPESQQ